MMVHNLGNTVTAIFEERKQSNRNIESEDDINWNYSLFVAQFLLKSTPTLQLTKKILEEELEIFNQDFSASVSLEVLQIKQWVRFIFDQIKIPHALLWACKDIKTEKDVDEKYKDYFEELRFIGILYNKYGYEDSRPFKISKEEFAKICSNFRHIYPKLPNENELVKKFNFQSNGEYYTYEPFKFRSDCGSKIAANLWMLMDNTDIFNKIKKWQLMLNQFFIFDFINFLPPNQQTLYSENAINLLLQERDLIYEPKSEAKKVVTDSHRLAHDNMDAFYQDNSTILYPDTDNILLLWHSLANRYRHIDIYSQKCREDYAKILFSVLNSQKSSACISKILDAAKRHPYLFFQMLFYLKRHKPAELLNFLNRDEYGIIFYFEFVRKCFEKLNAPQDKLFHPSTMEVLKESVDLLISENFTAFNFKVSQFAYILIFLVQFRFSPDRRFLLVQKKEDFYSYAIKKLTDVFREKSLKSNIPELIQIFSDTKDSFLTSHNSLNSFEIKQFAYLFELLKMEPNNSILEKIQHLYTQNFLKAGKLFCTDEYLQIETFQWNALMNYIKIKGELESFCSSVFDYLNFDSDKGDDFNSLHTNADKLRLHLKILCLAYQQNVDKGIKDADYENYIFNILSHSFSDDNGKRSISILSSLYENNFIDGVNTSIFQFVIDVINTFSQSTREKFLMLLKNEGNFSLLFKTYNSLKNSEDKKSLEDFIKGKDFSDKLEEIYTIPDFIEVATNVINSKINAEFANHIIEELANIMKTKAQKGHISQYTYIAEELKLYQLYTKHDKEAISKYTFPYEDKLYSYNDFKKNLLSERLFYLSLLNFGENDKQACAMLENLCKDSPKNQKYKMYALYAKSCFCTDKSQCNIYLKEVDVLLKENISNKGILFLAKLKLLINLDETEKALHFFDSLDVEYRSDVEFASLIIKPILSNSLYNEALKIFNNIDSSFYNDSEYKELKKLLPVDKCISGLKQSYGDILNLADEDRFKVLPNKINKHCDNLGEYILGEIVLALNKTLKKIDLIQKISASNLSEDNITDLLELEINGRLSMLGYKVEGQNRSGKSQSGKNAGEIDLEISFNDISIIIEAVKFSNGAKRRKEHIEKTFNYDPTRRFMFNLIYFDGNNNFDESWESVKNDINTAAYPNNFSLIQIEDIASENNGIKIAKSKHQNNLFFYHIMGNFSYPGI